MENDLKWNELPSGWTKSLSSSTTGYAAFIGTDYYWWINRAGRTVIEGPTTSLDLAKVSVDQAYAEFISQVGK